MQISTSEPTPVNRAQGVLTDKQLAVYVFMREFFLENDQLPPQAAMQAHFGWADENSATQYRSALEAKGYIERNAVGKFRFVRVDRLARATPEQCQ